MTNEPPTPEQEPTQESIAKQISFAMGDEGGICTLHEELADWYLKQTTQLRAENTCLRALSAKHGCVYNNQNESGSCKSGYPGCACMDDLYAGEEFVVDGLKRENERLRAELAAVTKERDEAVKLVASYDRQDEVCGAEFEGVDETTEVIRLLKQERDSALAQVAVMREALKGAQTLVIEHHSFDVMKPEHSVCPKCTAKDGDELLTRIAGLVRRSDIRRKKESGK